MRQDGQGIITIGTPPIAIAIQRHAQARRYTLRVDRARGQVRLTLPPRGSVAEAARFAESREGWLRRQLAEVPPVRVVAAGAALPVFGAERRIVAVRGLRSARLGASTIEVAEAAVRSGRVGAQVAALLKAQLRLFMAEACAGHAAALGVAFSQIALRDPRRRWGSCSADGRLMFSWRLAMAPAAVADYVAAHEVAHLVELNHGPRFWALVERLDPDHAAARDWLRGQGAALHAWDFESA